MQDYSTQIVTALKNTGLQVYYELFCDSSVAKPCITYAVANDNAYATGSTLGYSTIQYTVKLWGDNLSTLVPYCEDIDEIMRELGFTRLAYNQLAQDNQICLIFSYEALALENI